MKMKNYIRQFLEDLEELSRQPPTFLSFEEPEDYMDLLMESGDPLMGYGSVSIMERTGISREQLPSIELLSDDDVSRLVTCLMKVLNHFNCYPVIPHDAPDSMTYKAIRDHWELLEAPVIDVKLHYDFCDGPAKQCTFPGYCKCCEDFDDEPALTSERKEKGGAPGDKHDDLAIEISLGEQLIRIRKLPRGKYITGIHNYCDRWCEYCPLATRCTVNAAGEKLNPDQKILENRDAGMKELKQQFRSVERKIIKEMQRLNVDVIELSKNEGFSILDKEEILFNPDAREVMTIAEHYTKSVHEWFKKEGEESLTREINENLVLENIMWYSTIIATKMYRSLMREFNDDDEDPVQNDLNGSAKVALHGIRQSLYCWGWLIEHCPGQKDTAMFHAMLLTGMRSAMEERFPRAEEFVRPGFDE